MFSLTAKDLLKEYAEYEVEDNDVIPNTPHPNSVLAHGPTSTPHPTPFVRKKPLDPTKLPEFEQEPQEAFIIRGKSAELDCKVRSATKAYFTCNGEAMAESGLHKERDFVESTTGEVIKELRLEIRRNMVEEFFGQYWCRCDAWSAKGMVSSRNVSVEMACKCM